MKKPGKDAYLEEHLAYGICQIADEKKKPLFTVVKYGTRYIIRMASATLVRRKIFLEDKNWLTKRRLNVSS